MGMLDTQLLAALEQQGNGPGWLRAILAGGGGIPPGLGVSPNEAIPSMEPTYYRDPPAPLPQSHAEPNEVWSHNNYGGDGPLTAPLPLPVQFSGRTDPYELKLAHDRALEGHNQQSIPTGPPQMSGSGMSPNENIPLPSSSPPLIPSAFLRALTGQSSAASPATPAPSQNAFGSGAAPISSVGMGMLSDIIPQPASAPALPAPINVPSLNVAEDPAALPSNSTPAGPLAMPLPRARPDSAPAAAVSDLLPAIPSDRDREGMAGYSPLGGLIGDKASSSVPETSLFGRLSSAFAPEAPARAAPAPTATPAPAAPSLGDKLGAGILGFLNGGGSLGGSITAASEGFGSGIAPVNLTERALMQKGLDPITAKAAARNPTLLAQILPQVFGSKQRKFTQIGEGAFGDKQYGFVDEVAGKTYDMAGKEIGHGGAEGGTGAPGSGAFLAKGVNSINSDLVGKHYLDQFSPEVKAAVENYVGGQSLPTGNPRKGFTQAIKMIAQKYGQDIGLPADDTTYTARRAMRTQLSSAAPSSLGGQINIGNTAMGHLADLAEKATALDNVSFLGPDVSWFANAARAHLSTAQAAKVDALKAAAQHYGQEITKFYAGSPGGEGERNRFLSSIDGAKTPQQLGEVIATEAELMHSRLNAIGSQIKGTLGPMADQYPVVRPESETALTKVAENVARLRGGQSPAAPAAAPAISAPDRAALEAEARRRGLLK